MAEFSEMLVNDYGIKKKPITKRNPQANAIVERVHQTIGNMIRTFQVQDMDDEDPLAGILNAVAFAVRATVHTTTQATPMQLVFGRDAIMNIQFEANWNTTHRIPLEDLIRSNPNPGALCNNTDGNSEKHLIESTILPENVTYSSHRRIPKIVHVTSKSACMTPAFIENIATWRFPGYALYFHDDVAVDRLLAKYWPEFPQLQLFQKCSVSGAAKADIWRLLVIWEYGGIYTDIDNAPGPKFDEGNIIQDDDDAWFVVERIGVLSQYFMAASPKHPLIYAGLTQLFQRLLDVENIREQYVPFVTGPGTMKSAMIYFMIDDKEHNYTKVTKGKYVGFGGRSVTIDGTPQTSNEYVIRESVRGIHKSKGYTAMGMVHFSAKEGRDEWPTSSCHEHLYMETIKLLDKEQYHLAAVEDSSSW